MEDQGITISWWLKDNQISINLAKPPEELEEITKNLFRMYTEETNPDYIDADKLSFIDILRKKIYAENFDDYRKTYARGLLDEALDTDGSFDLKADVNNSLEFAECCYHHGFRPFHYQNPEFSSHQIESIHRSLVRMIRAVMEYQLEPEEA